MTASVAPDATRRVAASVAEGEIEGVWSRTLDRLSQRPRMAAFLKGLSLTRVQDGQALLTVADKSRRLMLEPKLPIIGEELGAVIGAVVSVRLEVGAVPRPQAPGPGSRDGSENQSERASHAQAPVSSALHAKAAQDPVVQEAIRLFDGKIVEIRPDQPLGD